MDDQKERNRKTMESMAASLAEESPVPDEEIPTKKEETPKKSDKSI